MSADELAVGEYVPKSATLGNLWVSSPEEMRPTIFASAIVALESRERQLAEAEAKLAARERGLSNLLEILNSGSYKHSDLITEIQDCGFNPPKEPSNGE